MRRSIGIALLFFCAAFTEIARAEPAQGVTPTLRGRGTYEEFKVKTRTSMFEFEAEAEPEIDIVVRTHAYAVGGTTGWHAHPGPVFITVVKGELTVYERDDPTCTPKVLREGQGYVDTGRGHIVRNESGAPAEDVSVIIAPVGLPFRTELSAPWGPCGF